MTEQSTPLKIYLASSWRNKRYDRILAMLRDQGHEVYDFQNPPQKTSFSWTQVSSTVLQGAPAEKYLEAVNHPIARKGFESDMEALRGCDVCVLCLPCGRSAHLEMGWAAGWGKQTIVFLEGVIDEPELMYLMCDSIVSTGTELSRELTRLQNSLGAR